jgi:hypothetical protein
MHKWKGYLAIAVRNSWDGESRRWFGNVFDITIPSTGVPFLQPRIRKLGASLERYARRKDGTDRGRDRSQDFDQFDRFRHFGWDQTSFLKGTSFEKPR